MKASEQLASKNHQKYSETVADVVSMEMVQKLWNNRHNTNFSFLIDFNIS